MSRDVLRVAHMFRSSNVHGPTTSPGWAIDLYGSTTSVIIETPMTCLYLMFSNQHFFIKSQSTSRPYKHMLLRKRIQNEKISFNVSFSRAPRFVQLRIYIFKLRNPRFMEFKFFVSNIHAYPRYHEHTTVIDKQSVR